MVSKILTTSSPRPLFIDFDAYTDGDNEFKKELVGSMVENLHELRHVLQQSDISVYHKVCHKIKPTISMLEDEEFQKLIHELHTCFTDAQRIEALDKMCQGIVVSLEKA
jgi:hypothetical protein